MRCLLALLFGTALLSAPAPHSTAAAFYWDPSHVAIVAGAAPNRLPHNAVKIANRTPQPPWGDLFALPSITNGAGLKTGDSFDVNLTAKFWVHATVSSFVYNKTQYRQCMLAIALVAPNDRERYTAANRAKLSVFLAEPAQAGRRSDSGQIRNPVVTANLPATERASLAANLNAIMMTRLHHAMLRRNEVRPASLSPLLAGRAKLTLDVNQVDLGPQLGVRQHVLGTWLIDSETVFSIQGWKRPGAGRIEWLEAVDGFPEDQAEILGAVADWGEESLDDFEVENVFAGGRLVRHSAGYESSTIYLERMSAAGRKFQQLLYST